MGISRRAFLSTGAAALAASGVGRAADARAAAQRIVGPQPVIGPPAGSLLLLFEGLCAFVTDKAGAGARKLDVALVNTRTVSLAGVTNHAHVPTMSIARNAIKDLGGFTPAATDVQDAHFSIAGKRLRFVPKGGARAATPLAINEPALSVDNKGCPDPSKKWSNFNWLIDFRTEMDHDAQDSAVLLDDWRKKADVVDALVELRHGLVEDESLFTPDVPGNESARVFKLPAAGGTERALKEQVRALIDVPQVDIEVYSMAGAKEHTLTLDCGSDCLQARISQIPALYYSEAHNMHDLLAFWLLTNKSSLVTGNGTPPALPEPVKRFCDISATNGCGCCPGPRFVESSWKGQ